MPFITPTTPKSHWCYNHALLLQEVSISAEKDVIVVLAKTSILRKVIHRKWFIDIPFAKIDANPNSLFLTECLFRT